MPTSFASTINYGGGIQPTIIPPSEGDLEHARINRLMDLAKLRELTLAPGFEQQRLNLARQSQVSQQQYQSGVLGETSAHNVAEEKHWAQLLGLDHAKLQETAREHDSALNELSGYHQGVLKNQLTEGFMAHLAPLYGADVAAKVLQNRNLPELTSALDLIHKDQNEKLANTTLGQIQIGQQKGIDVSPIVENLKTTNPEAYGMIKDKLPTPKPTDTRSTGTKLGSTLRNVGPYMTPIAPFYALYQGIKGINNKVTGKSFKDFAEALVGQ